MKQNLLTVMNKSVLAASSIPGIFNETTRQMFSYFYGRSNAKQEQNFKKYYPIYHNLYQERKSERSIDPLLNSSWKENNHKIAEVFKHNFPFGFLNNAQIRKVMFVAAGGEWQEFQLNYLTKRLPRNVLITLLKEEAVGMPYLTNISYQTSHNTIHNLTHWLLFNEMAGINLASIKTVVEWGGGYGNMARLFRKMNQRGTYIMIDTPLFAHIQALYLSTVLGSQHVSLLEAGDKIKVGKINIIALDQLSTFQFPKDVDLFLSTWALTESSLLAQKIVQTKNYFGAKHLLLAYHENITDFPSKTLVAHVLKHYSPIYHSKISYLSRPNYYLFAKSNNL